MRWRLFRWCLVGAIGCALAAPAAPAEAEEGSSLLSPEEQARELSKQADIAFSEGRKDKAVDLLRAAWTLYKDKAYICVAGISELELGRARDAAESLSTCLRALPDEDRPVVGKKVERELKKARDQVGALTVEANVPGAEVLVNGKVAGKLPLKGPLFVDPGKHGVEVRASGYETDAKIAVLEAGSSLTVLMHLEPIETSVAPAPGEPLKPAPKTPIQSAQSAQSAPNRSPASPGVERDADSTPNQATNPARPAVLLAAVGLGVVGAAVGVGGLMIAAGMREDAEALDRANSKLGDHPCTTAEQAATCLELESLAARAPRFTAIGVGGFVALAAGGTLAVYELVRSSPQGGKANARIAITAAPDGGALKISGSF